MGGRPLSALAIAAFPDRDFPEEWAAEIVRGGAAKLAEAGCALLGGHSVRDPEVKYGYAITGLVDPRRMITNAGGREGQVLVLTKPLGTGVVSTALKAGRAPATVLAEATRAMAELNSGASRAALDHGVTGGTDVTGFGLLGHAEALARESGITLEIHVGEVPLLPGAIELALDHQAGGLKANRLSYELLVEYQGDVDAARRALLYDPQTSGGLLLLVPQSEAGALVRDVGGARAIGMSLPVGPKPLIIRG
jgi:selenide,water dikinase